MMLFLGICVLRAEKESALNPGKHGISRNSGHRACRSGRKDALGNEQLTKKCQSNRESL